MDLGENLTRAFEGSGPRPVPPAEEPEELAELAVAGIDDLRLDDADLGFSDIAALSMDCRFGDCRHLREPGCAVRAGVGGALSARRYESYRRLRRLWERLRQPSG